MTSETTKVRPAEPSDIPQVADIFSSVFRKKIKVDKVELNAYLAQLLFSHPNYTKQNGSIVSVDGNGIVKSALTIVPMTYRIGDEHVVARLLCTFMAAEDANPRSIAALIFQIRPKGNHICFSDSAAPVSVSHLKAIGGIELPVQGLRWFKVFRPFSSATGYIRRRVAQKYPSLLSAGALPTHLIDAGQRARADYSIAEASPAEYADHANRFLSAYAVAPVYTAAELVWTIDASAGKEGRGRLCLAKVCDRNGDVAGVFSFVGTLSGEAQILDLLSRNGMQDATLDSAFHALKCAGYSFASGQLRPEMIVSLSKQDGIWYRHITGVSAASRSEDFKHAIRSGQAYIGGIAGESWSRLVRDFH